MADENTILRQRAARARALVAWVSDPLTIARLQGYATECDASADQLEAAEPTLAEPPP